MAWVQLLRYLVDAMKKENYIGDDVTNLIHQLLTLDPQKMLQALLNMIEKLAWAKGLEYLADVMKKENCMDNEVTKGIHQLLTSDPQKMLQALHDMTVDNPNFKRREELASDLQRAQLGDIKHPENLDQLINIMTKAAKGEKKVKGVSTQYSAEWNEIASTDGCLINTATYLNKNLEIETNVLKDKSEDRVKSLCHFQAGATIEKVQEFLWPLNERKTDNPEQFRYLSNATSGVGLSLAGTIGTGAHGNGIRVGIMADAVLSFRLITIDENRHVKQYQMEPTIGITDPVKFAEQNQNVELKQDDDVFNASVTSIGCMGVVYSYILRVEPGCYLEEERILLPWSEAAERLPKLMSNEQLQSFQLLANPYPLCNLLEAHVSISTLKRVGEKNQNPSGERPILPKIPERLLDDIIVFQTNKFPMLTPVILKMLLQLLSHKSIVLNACDALNTLGGVISTKFVNVRTSECGMKVESANDIIDIFDSLIKLYADLKSQNQLINVPIAFRFMKETDKFMAMGYDRQSCMIEQSILNSTTDADDTLKQFRDRMRNTFGGRPHWGMLHEMDAKRFKDLYKKHERDMFKSALKQLDPNKVFTNDFTQRVFNW